MPWRPWATRSPRLPPPSPRPGVRPNSDPEAWVPTTSSSLRPAAAFSPGRSAQRPSRPAPLTHGGGGAVSGGDSLGPASSSLQARGGHHGVCDQARCGPQRSRRREDARAVPRRREWGGGPRSLQPREKPAFAGLVGVQRDRKVKEKEHKGDLASEEPEGRTPVFAGALKLHFQGDASHVQTFSSTGSRWV